MARPTYIVTGGGSGSGRTVAAKLSARGCSVVVWGRDEAKLRTVVDAGDAVGFAAADLSVPEQVDNAFRAFRDQYGNAAGFVHCAGIWTGGALVDVSPQVIVQHIGAVTLAATLCLRGAVSVLSATQGRIVQIAAASAKPGFGDTALNTLAKRAQDGLQEGLARELRGSGIKLTTLYPDSIAPASSKNIASGSAMSFDDIADLVLFVLFASPSMHIQEILVTAANSGR